MKENNLRKIGVSLGVMAVLLPALASVSLAQEGPDPMQKDTNPIACEVEGARRWGDFISALVAYDGVVEYWKDIFARNRCQSYDIENILNRLKKVRQQIRAAFYACDDARAKALSKTYYKLLVELDYVRGIVVNTDPDNPKSKIAVLNPGLYQEMKKRFVNDAAYFSTGEFDELFAELDAKYASKRTMQEGSYLNCNDPVFDQLVEKFNEFVENVGGLKSGAENAGKGIKRSAKKLQNSPNGNYGNLLGGFLDFKINQTEPKQALEQIYETQRRDIPFADSTGVSHRELVEGYQKDEKKYESEFFRNRIQGEILLKYQQNTDSIRDALQAKLQTLNTTIKDTYEPLNKLTQCVQTIGGRQCKSKQ